MQYRFEDFLLDTQALELSRAGERVTMSARTLSLLVYLVENRQRVVSRDELAEHGWPGRYIAEQTLTARISELRAALKVPDGTGGAADGGRDDAPQRLIRTVYGQGLRFVGAVTVLGASLTAPDYEPGKEAPRRSGRPSIAVLPFAVPGESTKHHSLLAQALPDEIITALSKLRWLFVISRGSTFQFPSYAFAPGEVGARLSARYSLAGSLEQAVDKLIISVELADNDDAEVVWRERFTEKLRGVHEVRSAIAERVASELDNRIPAHELHRTRMLAPDNLDAWQSFHRGLGLVLGADIDRYGEARELFTRALDLDPQFARARAGLANTLFLETIFRNPDAAQVSARGEEEAERAFAMDPRDPYCALMRARMRFNTGAYGEGLVALQEVIALSPSNSIAHSDIARMQVIGGDTQGARRSIETALRLNPLDPYNHTSFITLSLIELTEGNIGEAARIARESQRLSFRSLDDRIVSLMAFDYGGEPKLAREEADRIRRDFRDLTLEAYLAPIPVLTEELKQPLIDIFTRYRLE